jgi:glyoxylase-like metal-dependent hydrolase (beta-lactamase superfamily II)
MIEVIDCGYTMPRFAAAYLVVRNGRAAFVDNNTAHAVPRMLQALHAQGLSPDAVDYCIITHVHLDHAGGSSALMKACPNATLIAHPRAAKHAIDPSKLIASASEVYGKERFEELYGVIEPIAKERVRTMEDGETLRFADRTLRFLHTRGHANHHFVILVEEDGVIFTGDAFGLCYPDLCDEGLFAFPSTSPTDFDGPLAREAVKRIVDTGAHTAYLTHFGPVTDLEGASEQLIEHLNASEQLMEEAFASDLPDDALEDFIEPKLRAHFEQALAGRAAAERPETWERLNMDLELNAQGLAFVAAKKRRKASSAS